MKRFFTSKATGFTLVEIIVSLGVFSVVAVVALGALVRIVDANRKAQTLQSAMTNLNFALESISRELRVGKSYYCSAVTTAASIPTTLNALIPCGNGIADGNGALIAFRSTRKDPDGTSNDNELINAYRFVPETMDDGTDGYILEKAEQIASDTSIEETDFAPITDPNLILTNYYVEFDYEQDAVDYPLIVIKLSGYAGVREKDRTYFDLQTAISGRIPY